MPKEIEFLDLPESKLTDIIDRATAELFNLVAKQAPIDEPDEGDTSPLVAQYYEWADRQVAIIASEIAATFGEGS